MSTPDIRARPVRGPVSRFLRAIHVLLGLKEPRSRVPGTRRHLAY